MIEIMWIYSNGNMGWWSPNPTSLSWENMSLGRTPEVERGRDDREIGFGLWQKSCNELCQGLLGYCRLVGSLADFPHGQYREKPSVLCPTLPLMWSANGESPQMQQPLECEGPLRWLTRAVSFISTNVRNTWLGNAYWEEAPEDSVRGLPWGYF